MGDERWSSSASGKSATPREWADPARGDGRPVGEGEINEGKGEGDPRPSKIQGSDRIRRGRPLLVARWPRSEEEDGWVEEVS